MDAIKAEIARRKAELSQRLGGASSGYVKRSQLLQPPPAAAAAASAHAADHAALDASAAADSDSHGHKRDHDDDDDLDLNGRAAKVEDDPLPEVKEAEVHRRLRHLGEPIALFGETLHDKRRRLRELEMMAIDVIKERQRNDLQDAMENVELEVLNELAQGKDGALQNRQPEKPKYRWKDMQELGKQLGKHDLQLDMTLIRRFFRYLLDLWGYDLDCRPKTVRDSQDGRLASAIHRQTSEYLKPLFKNLKNKTASEDITRGVREIVQELVKREYIRANDAYLRVAIGNAAWPIGVTNVGIHSRTGREKIFSQNIAHVLNDETQRKYIQAIKRLMTFCQKRFPNVPSKCLEYRGLQKGLYPVSYEAQNLNFDQLPDDSTPPSSPSGKAPPLTDRSAMKGDGPTPA